MGGVRSGTEVNAVLEHEIIKIIIHHKRKIKEDGGMEGRKRRKR